MTKKSSKAFSIDRCYKKISKMAIMRKFSETQTIKSPRKNLILPLRGNILVAFVPKIKRGKIKICTMLSSSFSPIKIPMI